MTELLSKDRTMLERPFMEFRPFGVDEHGEKIRDSSACMVNGDEWCEWEVTWEPTEGTGLFRIIKRLFAAPHGEKISYCLSAGTP